MVRIGGRGVGIGGGMQVKLCGQFRADLRNGGNSGKGGRRRKEGAQNLPNPQTGPDREAV